MLQAGPDGDCAGASGFLLKDATADELITGVRVVARDDALLAPTATRRLVAAYLRHQPLNTPSAALDHLTDRERDVLRQIGLGRSNTEIAAEFVVSENTMCRECSPNSASATAPRPSSSQPPSARSGDRLQ